MKNETAKLAGRNRQRTEQYVLVAVFNINPLRVSRFFVFEPLTHFGGLFVMKCAISYVSTTKFSTGALKFIEGSLLRNMFRNVQDLFTF